MKQFYVYILFNQSRTLYIGVTSDLLRRLSEHRLKLVPGFTQKYNVSMLAYYEVFPNASSAFAREKQLKVWTRAKKLKLIEAVNPHWQDLTASLRDMPASPAHSSQILREYTQDDGGCNLLSRNP
jgi:putative endonuclease